MSAGLKLWKNSVLYQQNLSQFIEQYQGFYAELMNALTAKDFKLISAKVHKLKGTSGALALDNIAAICRDVESTLETGEDIADSLLQMQDAITQVANSLSFWLSMSDQNTLSSENKVILIDAYNTRFVEVEAVILQLLKELDSDNPKTPKKVLAQLETLLSPELLKAIKTEIYDFNFREAEILTMALLHSLKQSKGNA